MRKTEFNIFENWLNNKDTYTLDNIKDSNDRILLAEKKTINLFKRAAKQVPAYKDFLKKNKIKSDLIKTIQDYEKVPSTTKENYIDQYSVNLRCWNGDITSIHTFAASSGSTGEPRFWPRETDQEIEGAKIHKYLLEKVFDVTEKKTLFINSFGLGNWIAGMYTQICLYLAKLQGTPFTLASPGYNQEETFKVVKNFSSYFDQTIIACHPPILKMMIENGIKEDIQWKKLNIKFWGAGEGFSENWRDYLISLVGQRDPLHTVLNIYGSADAGLMGFETPLSILIHRELTENDFLNGEIFGNRRTPYLYQFDPCFKFLDKNEDNEIMITADASAPLIKYNIHDKGNIIKDPQHLLEVIDLHIKGFREKLSINNIQISEWNLPFVYVYGRDKFMVSLYGVNIYPENVKSVLELNELQPFLTGRFIASKEFDRNNDQYLLLKVEMKPGVKSSKKLETIATELFVKILKRHNSEYNQVEEKFKDKMHPKFRFYKYQDPQHFPEGEIKKMG